MKCLLKGFQQAFLDNAFKFSPYFLYRTYSNGKTEKENIKPPKIWQVLNLNNLFSIRLSLLITFL